MKRIAKPFIDSLIARTDLVRLVGARVPLRKKSGSNHWACCPFHEEKTPSFSVNEAQQFYHCFGCGVGGDAIRFLMDMDNLTFTEAVEQLADFNGVAVEYEEGRDMPENERQARRAHHEQGLACLQDAADFFVACLWDENGQAARAYLRERGLKKSTLTQFQLGYAPGGHALREHLQGKYGEALLVESGLLGKAEDGHTYDWFRDRIIFPIHNVKGQVIAFGARALGQAMPKYLNSPETAWFSKRYELYGMHQAIKGKQRGKKLLVTEGYMDVVKLAQYGMDEAVAALGTAIGDTHIAQLAKRAEKIVFAFDGDQAGEKAAEKALEAIFNQFDDKREWRFAFMPAGEDPDSLVQKYGLAAMHDVLDQSLTPSRFLLRLLDDGLGAQRSVEAQTALLAQAQVWLNKLPQGSYRHLLADAVQEHFALADGMFTELLPADSLRRRKSKPVTHGSVRQTTAADVRLVALLQSCPHLAFAGQAKLAMLGDELPFYQELVYRICACGAQDAVIEDFVAQYDLAAKIAPIQKTLGLLGDVERRLELEDMVGQVLARRTQLQGRLENLRADRI